MAELIGRFLKLEPALIRGILVAIAGLVAQVVGRTIVTDDTIDLIIDIFTGISAIVAAIWTRGAVTANAKVVVENAAPFEDEPVLVPGQSEIEVTPQVQRDLINAAESAPAAP